MNSKLSIEKAREIYTILKGLNRSQLEIVEEAMEAVEKGKQVDIIDNELVIL